MQTYGDRFISTVSKYHTAASKLAEDNYDPTELRQLVVNFALSLELLLKTYVFPAKSSRDTLESFIDELNTIGLSITHRDAMHALRKKYNKAKHDPQHVFSIPAILPIFGQAIDACRVLVQTRSGQLGTDVLPTSRRVFWIAAWDHFAHGDTEIEVMLPGPHSHHMGPPRIDSFSIDAAHWDRLKEDLEACGDLANGRGIIPEELTKAWSGEGDFLGSLVFEGAFDELFSTLGMHIVDLDLLPGLNRTESPTSMTIIHLMAAMDAATQGDASNFEDRTAQYAQSRYGVPADFAASKSYVADAARFIRKIDKTNWQFLSGPIWMTAEDFEAIGSSAVAEHDEFRIIATQENVIAICRRS